MKLWDSAQQSVGQNKQIASESRAYKAPKDGKIGTVENHWALCGINQMVGFVAGCIGHQALPIVQLWMTEKPLLIIEQVWNSDRNNESFWLERIGILVRLVN